jgi:hypothetical protein
VSAGKNTELQPIIQVLVGDLFKEGPIYSIPAHQRPYEWTTTEVETLLEDVHQRYSTNSANSSGIDDLASFYHFNAITWYADDHHRIIFDGQQRVATLYLATAAWLSVVVEALREPSITSEREQHLRAIQQRLLVALRSTDTAGKITYRLVDQFAESNEEIKNIVATAGKGAKVSGGDGHSKAYNTAVDWYKSNFPGTTLVDTAEELCKFLDYLFKYGVFSAHQVATENEGWDAFDKANNRGRPLRESDRLKHLLWFHCDEKDRPNLVTNWNQMMHSVRKRDADLDEVLSMVFTAEFAKPTEPAISKKNIYKSIQKPGLARDKAYKSPADFVVLASVGASQFLQLDDSVGPHGKTVPALQIMKAVYGKVPTQLAPLLLAGRRLNEDQYKRLATALLEVWVVHNGSGALPAVFTKSRATWLPVVRKINTDAELEKFIRDYLDTFKSEASVGFSKWFQTLSRLAADGTVTKSSDRVIKYLLGRCDEALALEVGKVPAVPENFVANYIGKAADVELEHILPEVFDESDVEISFGGIDNAETVAQTIGNLTLLTKDENGRASNNPYSDKSKEVFSTSKFYLSRALHVATTGALGSKLSHAPLWHLDAIRKRHTELYQLCCTVLGVPAVENFLPSVSAPKENKLGFRMVQANTATVLLDLAMAVSHGKTSAQLKSVIRAANLDSDRQYGYYMSALRELGVVERNGSGYKLTDDQEIAPTKQDLAGIIINHPASKLIDKLGVDGFKKKAQQEYDRSSTTTERQCEAHVGLREWALAAISESNED